MSNTSGQAPKIVVSKDGPYLVSGSVPLLVQTIGGNEKGESWDWLPGQVLEAKPDCALCRCGHSGHAPYCDNTHEAIHFNGTETASREPYHKQKVTVDGPVLVLDDAKPLCSAARFCDAILNSWETVSKTDDPAMRELLLHQTSRCPSGRLVARDKTSDVAIEPAFDPPKSIGIAQDAPENCSGPLWIRGGIQVESQDGQKYEVRNRMTLCRCGASNNKPFCDGTHLEIKYKDGMRK